MTLLQIKELWGNHHSSETNRNYYQ